MKHLLLTTIADDGKEYGAYFLYVTREGQRRQQ